MPTILFSARTLLITLPVFFSFFAEAASPFVNEQNRNLYSPTQFVDGKVTIYGEAAASVWKRIGGAPLKYGPDGETLSNSSSDSSLSWLPGVGGGNSESSDGVQTTIAQGIECEQAPGNPVQCSFSISEEADRSQIHMTDSSEWSGSLFTEKFNEIRYAGPAARLTFTALGGDSFEEAVVKIKANKDRWFSYFSKAPIPPRKVGRGLACAILNDGEDREEAVCAVPVTQKGLKVSGVWVPSNF